MSNNYNAIIIGAGIIGCCIAYDLSKKGYRTLNIDFQPAAGAGSTSNSCGNVRFYYSTHDGVAVAYDVSAQAGFSNRLVSAASE